jgi:hypothetical protein
MRTTRSLTAAATVAAGLLLGGAAVAGAAGPLGAMISGPPVAVEVQLQQGIVFPVSCSTPCHGQVTMTGKNGIITTGSARITSAGGHQSVKLRAARTYLDKLKPGARVTVTFNALNDAGDVRDTVQHTLTVR